MWWAIRGESGLHLGLCFPWSATAVADIALYELHFMVWGGWRSDNLKRESLINSILLILLIFF